MLKTFTHILVSEVLFCGGKLNGHYQAPRNCQSYIACSYGVTSHVPCPPGKVFDTIKRICELPINSASTCKLQDVVEESKWNIIWTLKRGSVAAKTNTPSTSKDVNAQ